MPALWSTRPSPSARPTSACSVLNRHLQERITLDVAVRGIAGMRVAVAEQLHDGDLYAVNSRQQPDRVKPSVLRGVELREGSVKLTLEPASWNLVRLEGAA